MKEKIMRPSLALFPLLLLSLINSGLAQQQKTPVSEPDIVRINTELAQTSVTVVDKHNNFVAGLKPEEFEVRVDGKAVSIKFLEHVITGATRTSANVSRVRTADASILDATPRGRTIIFFIDDLHLSQAGVELTRKAFLDFIEKEMGPDDQVAVASPSGQIGFLQSLTDVKAVLRAAIGRLHHRPHVLQDTEHISMTEYQAIRIDQGDRDATQYYVTELLKSMNYSARSGGGGGAKSGGAVASSAGINRNASTGGMSREMAERHVKNRAQSLLRQSAAISVNTLSTLEGLMRSATNEPGRKLLFMISDGFYLNDRNTGFSDKLKQITDAATRAGVVIYTMDAKGLVGVTDASSNRADMDGRLARANVGERKALQDPLTAMAANTGGRAFLDSDAISTGLKAALGETSNYYVLAWRPPAEEQQGGNFKRVDVSIVGRPDLTVRLARGFLVADPRVTNAVAGTAKSGDPNSTSNVKENPSPLRDALISGSSKRGLPTKLSTSFLDVPNSGLVLTVSTQLATDVLGYGTDGKQTASIDLVGVVLDDQGKPTGNFKTRITVKPATKAVEHPGVIYTHKLPLKSGIYQIRVAARDENSGRVGSAMQWIEIPDLSSEQLTLSSLMIGGQFIGSTQTQATGSAPQQQVQFSVDRRFRLGSHMNFLAFIYNAAKPGTGNPQLEAQIVISKNGQAVVTSPVSPVNIGPNTDLARIIYGADIALQNLSPGRYLLQVKVDDRIRAKSAKQQATFEID